MVNKEIKKIYTDIEGVAEKARPFNIISEENNSLIILVHGFTGSPYDMHSLAEYLFSQGFDINTILLKGHGSNLESLRQTTYVDWYTSLKEVIQANIDRYDSIFIIGYSFGANLGFEACIKFNQIKGIISLGIPIYLQEEKYIRLLLPLARVFKRNYRKKWVNKRHKDKLK